MDTGSTLGRPRGSAGAPVALIALLAVVCSSGGSRAAAAPGPARRPNILVIVADDQGYADIGVHGCKDIPTPNIDSIAANGVRCTSGYVSGPYCSPTRAALLTGRYQQRFGHEFNPGPNPKKNRDLGLPVTETTVADRLKAAGYATGLVGKWHLGGLPKFRPQRRGFDEFFGFLGGAHSYFHWGGEGARGQPILRGDQPVVEDTYLTDALGREGAAFVERHKEHPFLLLLTFNAVHTPMHATPKYLERFKDIKDERRRTYAAMTSAMDDAIGVVLAKLRESGLEENTLVFYISDNGGPPVNGSNNGPLRGHKAQTFEGGVRVPWLAQWKGHLPAGKTYDRPVIQLDIPATALAAAGVTLPGDEAKKLDGVNLLPHLRGESTGDPHDALYWRFGRQMAVRKGDWKLVRGPGANAAAALYDLSGDIGESKDLAASQPEKVKQLQADWDRWNAGNIPPAWGREKKARKKQPQAAPAAAKPAAERGNACADSGV